MFRFASFGFSAMISLACAALFTAAALSARAADPPAEKAKTVRLAIDYGDGVEKHFTSIGWKDKMTVLDAMLAARRHPRGIRFEFKGQGPTGFLTSIDGLENEGRGRNWTYRVNGKLADESFAVRVLKPRDVVLWRFGKYR